ncbi:hypothetical protein T8T21_16625 (plasmid) [Limimaricola variabilis]|uniref:hypothetical protein n=1 Tax=Limimaricola variabilis TaxID=1492771 RepID=UPI002AC89D59|nr:hypothetical protein [Limimaricola variabilis]WPY96136.1 hypothetical protein T8T21_16625 [Limimaricola variabilis]
MTDTARPPTRARPAPARLPRLILWGGTTALAAGAALAGRPLLALAALGAMALAGLLPLYTRVSGIHMPRGLASGVLLYCLAAFVAGEAVGLYQNSAVWDLALHVLSAMVLALAGLALALLPTAGAPPRTAAWVLGVLAVGFAALVGAAWELFEFSIDQIFGTNAQRSGLPDTMGDVAANLAGAVYGAIAGIARLSTGARWPLSGLLAEFCARNPVIYGDWRPRPFARPRAATRSPR